MPPSHPCLRLAVGRGSHQGLCLPESEPGRRGSPALERSRDLCFNLTDPSDFSVPVLGTSIQDLMRLQSSIRLSVRPSSIHPSIRPQFIHPSTQLSIDSSVPNIPHQFVQAPNYSVQRFTSLTAGRTTASKTGMMSALIDLFLVFQTDLELTT